MKIKRSVLLLFALVLLCTAVNPSLFAARAADKTPQVLLNLMAKFPHKAYWNHVGSPINNPDGVTDSPCPTHVGCSWVEGACTCNSFLQAIQCMGFAYKAAYDLVGTNPREWEKRTTLEPEKLRVGDIIRYRGNRHSLCVTGVNGNSISFVDANWYPLCQIRWDSMDLDTMPSFSYVLHDPDNDLKNSNLDFYLAMTQNPGGYFEHRVEHQETWKTTAVMNLRKRTSTDSKAASQLPENFSFIVEQKKLNNGYLWGKTTYNGITGWVALDYCIYQRGTINAPQFKWFSDVRPVNTPFKLFWTAVSGADYYKVFIYNEDDVCIAKAKTADTTAPFTLNKVGACYAEITSHSKHAPSWVLTGEAEKFRVQKPQDIKITELKADTAAKTMLPGKTDAMRISVRPYCAFQGTVRYSSSNSSVVEVDALGNLLAVNCGKAAITAKDTRTGLSAVCAVQVVPTTATTIRQAKGALRETSVHLVWSKVPQATGYFVYRRKPDHHFQYIARVATNSFVDTGLSHTSEYTYLVKAFCETKDGIVTGDGSHAVAAATKPGQIKSLKIKSGKGKLTLKWKKNKRADSYLIYRKAKNGAFKQIAQTKAGHLTLAAKAGKTYTFKVRAVKTFSGVRRFSAMSPAASGKAT